MRAGFGMLVAAIAVSALLVSCGGTDSEGEASSDQGTAADEPQVTTTAPAGAICEEPPPTAISLGTPISGEVPGFDQCFTVEVPAGAATLTIELTGLTALLNLRVGYGSVDTVQFHVGEFWQSSEEGTADETIVIEDPEAGTYYINVAVATFRDESPFTLSADTS